MEFQQLRVERIKTSQEDYTVVSVRSRYVTVAIRNCAFVRLPERASAANLNDKVECLSLSVLMAVTSSRGHYGSASWCENRHIWTKMPVNVTNVSSVRACP